MLQPACCGLNHSPKRATLKIVQVNLPKTFKLLQLKLSEREDNLKLFIKREVCTTGGLTGVTSHTEMLLYHLWNSPLRQKNSTNKTL